MSNDTVRICRMYPSSGRGVRCLGKACAYFTSAGACLIEPNPKPRWSGKAIVIEVSESQWREGDVYEGADGNDEEGMAALHGREERQAAPRFDGMTAKDIARAMRDVY